MIITGFKMAITLGVTELEDYWMVAYLKIVIAWKMKFSYCAFKQVLRSENSHTDSLVALTSVVDFQFRREIPVEHIPKSSIQKPDEENLHPDCSPGQRDPIISFLKNRA